MLQDVALDQEFFWFILDETLRHQATKPRVNKCQRPEGYCSAKDSVTRVKKQSPELEKTRFTIVLTKGHYPEQ